jgi:hypothetical protein
VLNGTINVNDELERMWKREFVDLFMVLLEGIGKVTKTLSQNSQADIQTQDLPKYEAGALTIQVKCYVNQKEELKTNLVLQCT